MLTLYSHKSGPNGWVSYLLFRSRVALHVATCISQRVAMVCNELGLEYKTEFVEMGPDGMKGPAYLKINPNGRKKPPTVIASTQFIQYLFIGTIKASLH